MYACMHATCMYDFWIACMQACMHDKTPRHCQTPFHTSLALLCCFFWHSVRTGESWGMCDRKTPKMKMVGILRTKLPIVSIHSVGLLSRLRQCMALVKNSLAKKYMHACKFHYIYRFTVHIYIISDIFIYLNDIYIYIDLFNLYIY